MVLVDSSVWIDFFKGKETALPLMDLVESSHICINDLILAELTPFIVHKKEKKLLEMLNSITKIDLVIDWKKITAMQILNLKSGINKVGLPDLVIIQNALDKDVPLYSLDNHFFLMEKIHGFKMFNSRP